MHDRWWRRYQWRWRSQYRSRSGGRALSALMTGDRPGDLPAWLIVLTEPVFLILIGLVVLSIAGEVFSPSHADWLLMRG
jgi:hypothetical protein